MPQDPAREADRRRLIERLRAEMMRLTGRRYERLDLGALDVDGLRDLQRFLQDVEAELGDLAPETMDVLRADLTAPKYEQRSDGRIALEPKDRIRERTGRSPDHGDALALALVGRRQVPRGPLFSPESLEEFATRDLSPWDREEREDRRRRFGEVYGDGMRRMTGAVFRDW